jgi:metal-dependent amidase/aminoacylase/carboxypeptidase family protein
MQETRTAGLAAERLRAAGYDVTTAIGKTGVVGLLRNGEDRPSCCAPTWMRCRSRR